MSRHDTSIQIYVDSDACPVKEEIMRVAKRHELKVIFVANSWMRLPEDWNAELIVVDDQFDAADNLIVEHIKAHDVVITADIPLADRCIKAGGHVVGVDGRLFTPDNIGDILASRNLLHSLRGAGEITGGPAPFSQADRSKFLQAMEKIIQQAISSL